MVETYFISLLLLMCAISGVMYGLSKAYKLLKNFRIAQIKFLKNYTADYITQVELKRIGALEALYIFAYTISIIIISDMVFWKWEALELWRYSIIMLAIWKITSDIVFRIRYGLKWHEPDRGSRIALILSNWKSRFVLVAVGIGFAIL